MSDLGTKAHHLWDEYRDKLDGNIEHDYQIAAETSSSDPAVMFILGGLSMSIMKNDLIKMERSLVNVVIEQLTNRLNELEGEDN